MHKKEKFIVLLIVLFARTAFLFIDAFFSSSQKKVFQDNIQQYAISQKVQNIQTHAAANTEMKKSDLKKETVSEAVVQNKTKQGLDFTAEKISEISKSIKNLDILEKIYQTKQDPEVLQALVQKLVGEYQFAKAKEYIADINIFTDKIIDVKTFLYTNINLLSSTDKSSMEKFMSFVDQMRYKGLISSNDYLFYQGIAKLWHKDYKGGLELLTQVKSPIYANFIDQMTKSLDTFETQKGVPGYYNDALIALVAMKNGYFFLANKLALSAVIANPEYILPHQILAYSSFLTHNRDRSIENFYDLLELDEDNQDKYNFYIGLAYYRGGQYQKSISTLSQLINSQEYKTDVYRYLLLNYQNVGDQSKMIKVWQQLLGQDNLQDSDFRYFYDIVFYRPFSENKQYKIYKQYKQLSYDFVSICYENLGQKNDTCIYGEAGLDVVNEDRQSVKTSLLYLSENYPQAHIFQALGDYYKSQNLDDKAKTYYLKAASLVDNITQESVIEDRLISELN